MELMIWFAQAKSAAKPGMLIQFLPFIVIFALFWFLIIRPQRKREKEHQDLLSMLKKGDKVVTNSGIFAEIVSVAATTAVIEIAPKVKVTVQRNAIAGKVDSEQYAAVQENNPAPKAENKSAKSLKKKKK